MKRPLTLDDVPDSILAELALHRGDALGHAYACGDPVAVLLPLAEVAGPLGRKLNTDALKSILIAMRDGVPLPPVPIFREAPDAVANLMDGMHRWRASVALGFPNLPCRLISRDEAEAAYGHPQDPIAAAI